MQLPRPIPLLLLLAFLLFCLLPARSVPAAGEGASQEPAGTVSGPESAVSEGEREGKGRDEAEWERWEHVSRTPLPEKTRSIFLPALWMIRLFQIFVSPVDGPSCDFTPTCSSYGLQAVRKHGLILGVPMTTERIVRNHHPDNPLRYPLEEREGELYYLDPVENNDFWRATGP